MVGMGLLLLLFSPVYLYFNHTFRLLNNSPVPTMLPPDTVLVE